MIIGPSWYVGGWPDREKVCEDAITPFLPDIKVFTLVPDTEDQYERVMNDDGSPRELFLCSQIPQNYEELLPVARFYRGGGATDQGKLMDSASVQVAVIAETRDDAVYILELLRQIILAIPRSGGAVKRANGSWTQVTAVREIDGPEIAPELIPDNRMVLWTPAVDCRLPRNIPDYGPLIAPYLLGQTATVDGWDVSAGTDNAAMTAD